MKTLLFGFALALAASAAVVGDVRNKISAGDLVSADDGSSPSRGMEELNTMEQQDHIFSLVGECAPLTDSQSQSFIDSHGLPASLISGCWRVVSSSAVSPLMGVTVSFWEKPTLSEVPLRSL